MAKLIEVQITREHIDQMRDIIYQFMYQKDLSRSEATLVIISALDQMAFLEGVNFKEIPNA